MKKNILAVIYTLLFWLALKGCGEFMVFLVGTFGFENVGVGILFLIFSVFIFAFFRNTMKGESDQ